MSTQSLRRALCAVAFVPILLLSAPRPPPRRPPGLVPHLGPGRAAVLGNPPRRRADRDVDELLDGIGRSAGLAYCEEWVRAHARPAAEPQLTAAAPPVTPHIAPQTR